MEEAALLDRAGRLRTLWYVILPQVRGGIAVTAIFVFLNAWNEFMFAVVLGGNRVRPVTVAMFNFISVEQTQWSRLAAAAMLAMAARDPDRHLRPAPHREGPDGRRRQRRRPAMSGKNNVTGSVRLDGVIKRHGVDHRAARHRPRDRARRVLRAAGPVGLGQDHDLAHPGRARIGERRARADGRRRTSRIAEPGERDVAMVFQSYALYPHMTVAQNIGFPLKMVGIKPAEIERQVAEAAGQASISAICSLAGRASCRAASSSACALARAIVRQPQPLPARRAAVEPRRQAAARDPARVACAAARRSAPPRSMSRTTRKKR